MDDRFVHYSRGKNQYGVEVSLCGKVFGDEISEKPRTDKSCQGCLGVLRTNIRMDQWFGMKPTG